MNYVKLFGFSSAAALLLGANTAFVASAATTTRPIPVTLFVSSANNPCRPGVVVKPTGNIIVTDAIVNNTDTVQLNFTQVTVVDPVYGTYKSATVIALPATPLNTFKTFPLQLVLASAVNPALPKVVLTINAPLVFAGSGVTINPLNPPKLASGQCAAAAAATTTPAATPAATAATKK